MQRIVIKKVYKRIIVLIIMAGVIIPPLVVVSKKIVAAYSSQMNALFTPKEIALEISNISNPSVAQAIKEFVTTKTSTSMLEFSPQVFYRELKKAFPIVQKLDWHFSSAQVLHLTVMGTTPFCVINNNYVLGDKRRLLTPDLFEAQQLKDLPRITMHERWLGEKIDRGVFAFVRSIPATYWQHYTITYHNPSTIFLQPTSALCRCRIVTTEKTFFARHKFKALGPLFQDLCKRELVTQAMLKSSKKILLGFDFRLQDQIIVSFYEPSKRGKGS